MSKKARIVSITKPNGITIYQIQQKHWLFRWWWVAASLNNFFEWRDDTYRTLEEAKAHLCYYDGTKNVIRVVDI